MYRDLDFKVLTLQEIHRVLAALQVRRTHRSELVSGNGWINLIVFRLSCCCGLRSKEIQHLRLSDLKLEGDRPFIRVREGATKGSGRGRRVPLWWDESTLSDLTEWKLYRLATEDPHARVVRAKNQTHDMIQRNKLFNRWKNCLKVLGAERQSSLTIHCGRHTFISVSLHMGKSLVEVQRAAGHASILTTQIYLHLIPSNERTNIFSLEQKHGEEENNAETSDKNNAESGRSIYSPRAAVASGRRAAAT